MIVSSFEKALKFWRDYKRCSIKLQQRKSRLSFEIFGETSPRRTGAGGRNSLLRHSLL
jgi:hypothetical protein